MIDYIIYFALTIGILVFIHELGHFLAAKLNKIRADVFSIGFGKRLFGWNKINGFTFGSLPDDLELGDHTDYRLCILPLGGYVKIAGMVDESFDTKFTETPPEPYEFRSKSTPTKLFVISAGVLMNLLLTVIIFWSLNFFQGKLVRETTTVGYIENESFADKVGFETGDKVLKINGEAVNNWEELINALIIENLGKNIDVDLIRNGEETTITVPKELIVEAAQDEVFLPSNFEQPLITEVVKDSPADDAGIKNGDILLKLKNIPLYTRAQTTDIISSNIDMELPLVLLRDKDTVFTSVTPGLDGKIGVAIMDMYTGPHTYHTYSFFGAFSKSYSDIKQYTILTFTMLHNVITGKIKFNQAFGGPVKIAKYAARSADSGLISFLFFLSMLSLSLAIINILPFPVLDGGHFLIIVIEGIIRREIPVKVKVAIQNTGFILLLLLMGFIIYNDIISL